MKNNRQDESNTNSYMNRRNTNTQTESYHAFLESLKGKVVTIYRGGPESKSGKLLDVKSDYVTLYAQDNNNNNNSDNNNNNNNNKNQNNNQNNNQQNNNNQNTVVYYQAQHVKSISEDSKSNSTQLVQTDEEEIEFSEAETFAELIEQLANETIQINQGGPESKYGTLLGVSNDFLILYTEDDGIVYFNIHHVKSVCKYQDNNNDNGENGNGNGNQQQQAVVYPEAVDASDFGGVFKHLEHKWVAINRGGPEAMEGVLVENSGGHYTLVSNEEVLRIHPYHIRSISSGPKGSMQQNNQNNNDQSNNNQNSENQNNNQNNNQNAEASSNESKNENKEEKSKRSSSRSRERNVEKVVKTIDYQWKY